ncbi:MAG: helix-turn-helix domain-containing protein [Chloroflexota bacterium]
MIETIPAERVVSDVETLKAISDPVRLRILETMIADPHEPWTVKRLAKALGSAPTRLYHHIKVLEERDLITVAGTRVVQGIIETSYRPAQLSIRLDRALLSGANPEAVAPAHAMLASVFDSARDEIEQSLRKGLLGSGDDERRGLVERGRANLTPARATELRDRLKQLIDEYAEDDPVPGSASFGLLVALYPVEQQQKDESDD